MPYPDNFNGRAFDAAWGNGPPAPPLAVTRDLQVYSRAVAILAATRTLLEGLPSILTTATGIETPRDAAAGIEELEARMRAAIDSIQNGD